mgnify:FL=1
MVTATEPKVLTPAEQAVAEFMAEETKPPETPYTLKKGASLGTTHEGQPLGSKVRDVDRGRYFNAWDTRTGRKHVLNGVHRPFLDAANEKAWRFPDGKMCYSLRPIPGLVPPMGKLLCMLHADYPMRQHYRNIGIVMAGPDSTD